MMPTLIRASQVTPTMTPRVNVDETDLLKTKIRLKSADEYMIWKNAEIR